MEASSSHRRWGSCVSIPTVLEVSAVALLKARGVTFEERRYLKDGGERIEPLAGLEASSAKEVEAGIDMSDAQAFARSWRPIPSRCNAPSSCMVGRSSVAPDPLRMLE